MLLKTAALFHDAGFLENHNKHEEISCKLAKKFLPTMTILRNRLILSAA